jgi:hypothetical protein
MSKYLQPAAFVLGGIGIVFAFIAATINSGKSLDTLESDGALQASWTIAALGFGAVALILEVLHWTKGKR